MDTFMDFLKENLINLISGLAAFFAVQLILSFWHRARNRTRPPADQKRGDVNFNLQRYSLSFLVVLLIVLFLLWRWGANQMEQSIDIVMRTTTPLAATPSATTTSADLPTPTPLEMLQPTQTVSAAVSSTPMAGSTLFAQTQTSLPAVLQDRARRSGIAQQNYTILGMVASILVLLPSLLLVAFAYQRVPRMTKDLQKDLKNLGILTDEEELQHQQDKAREAVSAQLKEIAPDLNGLKREAILRWLIQTDIDYDDIKSFLRKNIKGIDKEQMLSLAIARNLALSASPDDMPSFIELLKSRFGPWEYLLPLMPLTFLMLACFIWIFFPAGTSLLVMDDSLDFNAYINARIGSIVPLLAGVISAYVFLIYTLVRRNNGSDLTPGAFWEAVRRLVVVFGLGMVITALSPKDPDASAASLILFAFLVGIFPTVVLKSLARNSQILAGAYMNMILESAKVDKKGAEEPDYSERLVSRHELSMLDDLTEWDTLRLEEANVVGLQGMATADLKQLITWTPFPTSQVLDWVDQAVLFLVSGAEPTTSFAPTFRTIGLRRASTLLEVCETEIGKQTVLRAAEAVQSKDSFDPLLVAELAAMRAQSLVNKMQEQVMQVKDKTTVDTLDKTLRDKIEAAISSVHNAEIVVDQAYQQVKGGGTILKKVFSKEAEALHTALETAVSKANQVQSLLQGTADNVATIPEDLAQALKTLGDQVTGTTDAKQLAQNLMEELNKIANPLVNAPAKAREFLKKAESIEKAAQTKQDTVPASVQEATALLKDLTELAETCQEAMTADPATETARPALEQLLDELKADGADKSITLLGDQKLNLQTQWTQIGSVEKAKAHADAEKLVIHGQRIVQKAEAAEERIRNARVESKIIGVPLPLTRDVLENILAGLRANTNLKRIQRYLIAERGA